MLNIDADALDKHITGNWGQDRDNYKDGGDQAVIKWEPYKCNDCDCEWAVKPGTTDDVNMCPTCGSYDIDETDMQDAPESADEE